MNEIYVRDRIRDMLRMYGYDVDTVTDGIQCHSCHSMIVPKSGRPDLKATWDSHIHPGVVRPTVRVEVKVVKSSKTSFDLRLITEAQRKGLTQRFLAGRVVYLALGIIEIDEKKRDKLGRIYLAPWNDWLTCVEARVVEYQNSIPLVARKGMLRVVQDQVLDIKHLLQGWELAKLKRGWGIPMTHPASETLNLIGDVS